MMEILKSHFREDEVEKVNQEIEKDTSFKEKMEKIKSGQVDIQLDNLEARIEEKTDENFEERFEAFKKAVLEAEEKLSANPTEQVTQVAQEAVKTQKEKLIAEVDKKMQEKLGIFGSVLGWLGFGAKDMIGYIDEAKSVPADSKPWQNISAKIMSGIATFFLGKLGYNNLTEFGVYGKPEATSELGEVDIPEPTEEEQVIQEEGLERMKKKLSTHFKIGAFITKEMGGEEFDGNDNYSRPFESIQGYRYGDLEGITFDSLADKRGFNKGDFDKVKKSLQSGEMTNIFDSLLSPERIKKLSEKDSIKKIFDELGIGDLDNFSWRELEIDKLLSLLSISLAGLTYLAYSGAKGLGDSLITRLLGIKEDYKFDNIKEEAEEYEKEVMPKDLLLKLLGISGFSEEGSKVYTLEDLKKGTGGKSEYLPYLEKINKFKEFVLNDLLTNERYNLGEQQIILENVSYKDIIELYLLFSGDIPNSVENIDNFNSSAIYGWIYKILDGSDSQGGYITKLEEELRSKTSNKVSEKDKKLIAIVLKKVLDETIGETIKRWLGISGDVIGKLADGKEAEIIGIVSAIAALLYFTPAGKIVKLLGLRGSIAAVGLSGFGLFYASLSNAAKEKINPVLEEKGLLDEIRKQAKEFTQEENEYTRLDKSLYTDGRLTIKLIDRSVPHFEIDGKKYNTDIGGLFPDESLLNEAYFGEKDREVYLCFDRGLGGNKRIKISEIVKKIGDSSLENNYKIMEDFFLLADLDINMD